MRRVIAIAAARAASGMSRRLRLGGGTALPGLVAERLDPRIVTEMASRLGQGSVLVTGTNGKTTTSRLLRNIVRAADLKPVANRAGSNMMRGVAAALVGASNWNGEFDEEERTIGVFEVDEATLPSVAAAVRPRVVVFTNLFRDQLDRYGEVEHVAALWRETVRRFAETVIVVLNADDPSVAALGEVAEGQVMYYGFDDVSHAVESIEHAADARWCWNCGKELQYGAVFFGHIGHWRCPGCGVARPAPDVSCAGAQPRDGGLQLEIAIRGADVAVRLPITGTYNACNALAAAAAGAALGIGTREIANGVAAAGASFGRQETLRVDGRDVHVLLAKNPAGLNQVLRTLTADGGEKIYAFFLNDGIADGRDISWIWDVDFELLAGKTRALTVSGTRAWDLALRLKYAGLDPAGNVRPDSARALRDAINRTPEDEALFVIPTYTAMLKVRDLLARWAGRGAFWEGE